MIKRKKSISLALAALATISLSGCSSVTSSSEGYILTYTYNGNQFNISTGQIIDRYLNENRNEHAATFYDALNEVVIRLAFEEGGDLAEFKSTVDREATDAVKNEQETADNNGQSWDEYLQGQITGDDLTTAEREQELFLQKQYEAMQTTVEEQYFERFNDYQRDTNASTAEQEMQNTYNLLYGENGYIQKQVPYHIRHILIQVDASDDYGYARGQISSDNAHKIYQVFTALANGNSFSSVANSYTDDSSGNTGSNGEKLGGEYIMDNEESFVNEFKLGIYTYDLLLKNQTDYQKDSNYQEKKDNLHIPESVEEGLKNFGVTWIPYGVIDRLEDVRNVETSPTTGQSVYGGDANYFPRNIYFNKYFQNRNVGFITNETLPSIQDLTGSEDVNSIDWKNYKNDPTSLNGKDTYTREDPISGKKVFSDIDNIGHYATTGEEFFNSSDEEWKNFQDLEINGVTKKVLCDQNGNPIMVVRNQESSSGIHLIVIERSAFDVNGGSAETGNPWKASIEEYYAPVSPKDTDQIDSSTGRPYWTSTAPNYTENNVLLPKQTYVQTSKVTLDTQINTPVQTLTNRVSTLSENIRTAIDTYDTYKWLNRDNAVQLNKIADQDIQQMVDNYIAKETRTALDSAAQTLEDSWMNYANSIVQQTRQREYMLLPEILAADFGNPSLYQKGAPGYNPAYDEITAGGQN